MFKFFLNFPTIPQVGRIEISEPFGFDGATHSVSQDDKRFGRDVVLGNEESELIFTRELFEKMNTSQFLPNGDVIDYASHGFDYLLDIRKTDGWEGEVQFIIQRDGIDFTTGDIDYFTSIFDYDSIKVKIIQNTKREEVKRNEDVVVNAFSDKDINGDFIRPCDAFNILLKAKPIVQVSRYSLDKFYDNLTLNGLAYYGLGNQILQSDIKDTLTFFPAINFTNGNDFVYIRADNELSNIKVEISEFDLELLTVNFVGANGLSLEMKWGVDIGTAQTHVFQKKSTVGFFDTSFEFTIPYIPQSGKIWIYLLAETNFATVDFKTWKTKITGTTTAFDSVIKGVRLIDLIKYTAKSISGLDVIAPMYDVGGEHYNNFAFSGYMLGGLNDKPFNNTFKSLMNVLTELNADYQINPTNLEIYPYSGYYANTEIGAFSQEPDTDTTNEYNKRYFLKTVQYDYKKSSKGRETNTENTIDDIHGQTQWLFPTNKADNNFVVDIDHIRSAFLIEEQRRKATNVNDTNSLENDTNLFLMECVDLAPSTTRTIRGTFSQQWDSPNLKILSTNFNWSALGIGISSIITITREGNDYVYSIVDITPTVITLVGGGVGNQVSGTFFMEIMYTISGVQFTNRTNEGFTSIEGVENPTNYSNLSYSIGRNLRNFYQYLNTAGSYINGKEISNTKFENNGNLVSQRITDDFIVTDKANIPINANRILNPIIHNITVLAPFDEATQLFEDIQNIKGFIRCQTLEGKVIKGYPIKAEYLWKEGELDLRLEEKFEVDGIAITKVGDVIFINETGYLEKNGLFWFKINGIYVSLYDDKNILLANTERWTNVSINGVFYENIVDFSDALSILLN
jgi:hypothetical protein